MPVKYYFANWTSYDELVATHKTKPGIFQQEYERLLHENHKLLKDFDFHFEEFR